MFKNNVHGLVKSHVVFLGFLALWTFLIREIFTLWAFLALIQMA